MFITISTLILSGISAVLYRLGGAHGYSTLYRDVGCSLISVLFLGVFIAWHWSLILVFGLTWGALSTYWKRGANSRWWNWLLTGLGYGAATLPFCFIGGYWAQISIRIIVLGLTTMLWSEIYNDPVWEECGRGALLVLTMPLLLLPI